jgi:hypothetical protein
MSSTNLLRAILGLTALNVGLTATQFYTIHTSNKQLHEDLYGEFESRIDTFEYTFREHIGVIESSLARLEGKNIFDEYNKEKNKSGK